MPWTVRAGLDNLGQPYPDNVADPPPHGADLDDKLFGVATVRVRAGTTNRSDFTGLGSYLTELMDKGYYPVVLWDTLNKDWAAQPMNTFLSHLDGLLAEINTEPRCKELELGNEIPQANVVDYCTYLRAASPRIRAAGLNVICASQGSGFASAPPGGLTNYIDYIQNWIGPANIMYVDAVCAHIYAGDKTNKTNVTDPSHTPEGPLEKLHASRTALDALGAAGSQARKYAQTLEFWITEFGWATGPLVAPNALNKLICRTQDEHGNRLNASFTGTNSVNDPRPGHAGQPLPGLMQVAEQYKVRGYHWFATRDYHTTLPDRDWVNFCGMTLDDGPGTHKTGETAGFGAYPRMKNNVKPLTVINNNKPVMAGILATDSITNTSAITHANVNPNGSPTTYLVQYGQETAAPQLYDKTSTVTTPTSVNGTVSVPLSGLTNNTKYHFRYALKNEAGTTYGPDQSFTTGVIVPPTDKLFPASDLYPSSILYPNMQRVVPLYATLLISAVLGTGSGTISGPGISISSSSSDNTEIYSKNSDILLTARPNADSLFIGWTGDIVSANPALNIHMDRDITLVATFDLKPIDPDPGGNFQRNLNLDDEWSFVRGPSRLLYAPLTEPVPTKLENMIDLTTFDTVNSWADLGATKGGLSIAVTNETTNPQFTPDGRVEYYPENSNCTVTTNLAESTLEHLKISYQGSAIKFDNSLPISERTMGVGMPISSDTFRLAALHRKDRTGYIRAYVFRYAQIQVDTSATFIKTGDQQTSQIKFQCLPDPTVTDSRECFFNIVEQTSIIVA